MKSIQKQASGALKEFIRRLFLVNSLRDKLIARILYETGCGVSELIGLKVKDVERPSASFENPRINFISDSRRSVISNQTLILLEQLIKTKNKQHENFVFSSGHNRPLSIKRIEQIISSSFSKDFKPKQIRYLHIENALRKGISIKNIESQTGLKSQRILQIAEHLNIQQENAYSLFFEQDYEENKR